MIWRMAKIGFVATAGVALVGGMLFGSDAISYLSSSAKSMRTAVKGNLPVEVELERARHELDRIIPEMQANIRMIAEDEVEVAELEDDIRRGGTSLGEEQVRIAKLRNIVSTRQAAYTLGGFEYTREQVKQDLARRFDRYKEAEIVLAGKRRLLVTREKALYAAKQMLDRARMAKVQLADQIEALESQHRLVQAASIGSKLETNNTALARTELRFAAHYLITSLVAAFCSAALCWRNDSSM